jgi:uncharacterized protein YecE (DUF72 family)
MRAQGQIRIGTSGFHYAHWVGPFYPAGMRSSAFLEFYAERFDTVEINNTFYRLPRREMLTAWAERTPANFLFAVKASRFTTHVKRLQDPKVSAQKFFDVIDALGDKLGPILFQLPPRWNPNVERLEAFLAALPRQYRYAFEFRDERWFLPETLAALRQHGAAFCIYDFDGRRSPNEVTAPFTYVRLHGPGRRYHDPYSGPALAAWAKRIRAWTAAGIDVYVYFDNDVAGYAAADAARLLRMVVGPRRGVDRAVRPPRERAARPAPSAPGPAR